MPNIIFIMHFFLIFKLKLYSYNVYSYKLAVLRDTCLQPTSGRILIVVCWMAIHPTGNR